MGPAISGKEKEPSEKNQGDRPEQRHGSEDEAPQIPEEQQKKVYPNSKGRYSQSPPDADHHKVYRSIEEESVGQPSGAEQPTSSRPNEGVIGSPVRSQPQEAHSYPRTRSMPPPRPPMPARQASVNKSKPEERSRGLDVDDKAMAPPSGFRMKMKLAWMGLKMKAKM